MPEKPQEQSAQESKEQDNGHSRITEVFRPLAKEIIKGGLITFATLSDSLAGIGKQFTEMVDEVKAEMHKKEPPPDNKSPKDSPP